MAQRPATVTPWTPPHRADDAPPREREPLIKAPEAAEYLGVSNATLKRLVLLQKIESVRFGRMRRFRKSALDRFIARNTEPARER